MVKYKLEGHTYLSLDDNHYIEALNCFFNFKVHVSSIQSLVDRTNYELYVMDGEDKYWNISRGRHLRNFIKYMN